MSNEKAIEWDVTELLDTILDCVIEVCELDGILDSGANSTWSSAMRVLAKWGRIEILEERSPRWIIGKVRNQE